MSDFIDKNIVEYFDTRFNKAKAEGYDSVTRQNNDLFSEARRNISMEDDSSFGFELDFRQHSIIFREAVDSLKIDGKVIKLASEKYEDIAQYMCNKLEWELDQIKVFPQGSAATKTLIKTPDNSNFDIDAVFQASLHYVSLDEPLKFFQQVGDVLKKYYSDLKETNVAKPEAKRRCWTINFPNTPFYLEFTPSIPLSDVEQSIKESFVYGYNSQNRYIDTALAVVDTPTHQWKTSNPKGFAQWIDDVSQASIIDDTLLGKLNDAFESRDVEQVQRQEIDPFDVLRSVIVLFKRHRDMAVRRKQIESEHKPISVLLVTLITQVYGSLAANQRTFKSAIEAMLTIAHIMKDGPIYADHKWQVLNPTVDGENFAEKWNDSGYGKHKVRTFMEWIGLLIADLKTILNEQDPTKIRNVLFEVFGLPRDGDGGNEGLPPPSLKPRPNRPKPRPVPPSDGLAH